MAEQSRAFDASQSLQQQVQQAYTAQQPLHICAGRSRPCHPPIDADFILDISPHQGIVNYHPTELVLTARAGTPLQLIRHTLAEQGQMLPFEPPEHSTASTLGGAIACALAGPARPYYGAARDYVLGCQILNGYGEQLRFGGQVMKNVAGFDISRLMCGARGTLGVLLEVSLKVLPRPPATLTLSFQMESPRAQAHCRQLLCQGLPITASAYHLGVLSIRFSAHPAVLEPLPKRLGGEEPQHADTFWNSWRDQRLDIFQASAPLWRISLPPGQQLPAGLQAKAAAAGECWEWGGQQHWLASDKPASALRAELQPCHGNASLYRDYRLPGAEQLAPALLALHQRLKHAFDPRQILNPLLSASTAAEV